MVIRLERRSQNLSEVSQRSTLACPECPLLAEITKRIHISVWGVPILGKCRLGLVGWARLELDALALAGLGLGGVSWTAVMPPHPSFPQPTLLQNSLVQATRCPRKPRLTQRRTFVSSIINYLRIRFDSWRHHCMGKHNPNHTFGAYPGT